MADMKDRLIDLILSADMSLFGTDKPFAEVYADYLIANGTILPPCKVGDTVYQVDTVRIYESKIKSVVYDTNNIAFDKRAIGKTVFLTKEAAEEALKERENE